MEFLPQQNRRCQGDAFDEAEILATGKHVIIIGGGDTGADCLGTSHRQKREIRPAIRNHADAPERTGIQNALAAVADAIPYRRCARGRWTAGLGRRHRKVHRRRTWPT